MEWVVYVQSPSNLFSFQLFCRKNRCLKHSRGSTERLLRQRLGNPLIHNTIFVRRCWTMPRGKQLRQDVMQTCSSARQNLVGMSRLDHRDVRKEGP